VGHIDNKRTSNFFIVDNKTTQNQMIEGFRKLTSRDDVAILLISQNVANEIRFLLDEYNQLVPTILEIPSKDHPYDPSVDCIMQRVNRLCGKTE